MDRYDVGPVLVILVLFVFLGWFVWFGVTTHQANERDCMAMQCPEGAQHLVKDNKCLCTTEARP